MTAFHRRTHEVMNQSPLLEGYDAFGADPVLRAALQRSAAVNIGEHASELGRFVGSAEAQHHATLANRYTPELKTHDRFGKRIDYVEYHPSYHVLMRRALGAGMHSTAWTQPAGGFSAHAALFYLWNQLEHGTACPVTMTFASIPVMQQAPALEREWRWKILASSYDPNPVPIAQKRGATIGMAMTEKQGGSDLRAVQTVANREGDVFRLNGHKWFCSAPMSDGFFTLARLAEGVTCFFVPRSLPDGERNWFLIQRLKEKVGNRSNASAEIEYSDTMAWQVGDPGRGIATLIGMAHHTRFDIVVGVAGMMRAALNQAVHHSRHRAAFGKRLGEHPLMANLLADMALESEAATLVAFRLAAAFDASASDEGERDLQRVLTPIAKYWLCKRVTPLVTEAMECLGGNGYVEESCLARIYREAPLNGIWEGSANVICLDALRALAKSANALPALLAEIAKGSDPRITPRVDWAVKALADADSAESNARGIVEAFAIGIQASLMKRYASADACETFCESRGEAGGVARAFGGLRIDAATARALVERVRLEYD